MRYFKLAFINRHFNVNGKRVDFEHVGGAEGVRKLDENLEAPLIAELDRAADQRRGGIVRISAEVYEGVKKNRLISPPSQRPPGVLPPIRIHNPESLLPKTNPPVPAAVSAGAVLTPLVKPTVVAPPPGAEAAKALFQPNRGRKSAAEKKAAKGDAV